MNSERDKMLAGEAYDPRDAELAAAHGRAQDLCRAFNDTCSTQQAERRDLLRQLLGSGADSAVIEPPFHCDYGGHIHLAPTSISTSTASCWMCAG